MTTQAELKVLTTLRAVELTRDMDTKHLKKLAAIAREVRFAEGEIIYQAGDAGRAIYLVQSGLVISELVITDQESVTMFITGPGQFFGWSSLFPKERKMFKTRAVQATRAIAFDSAKIRNAWQTDHNLEYAMIRRAAQATAERIMASRQSVANLMMVQNETDESLGG